MRKIRVYYFVTALVMLFVVAQPLITHAWDWWRFETIYTIQDRDPVKITGPASRIFLPKMTAETKDKVDMDIVYKVTKKEKTLASGNYAEGVYFDLCGAGTYVFTFTGAEASNSYSFEVVADENYASFVPDAPIPMDVYLDDAFDAPAAKIIDHGIAVDASISIQMASGAVYQYDDKAIPEAGQMNIQYSAEINGKMVEFNYYVDVIDNMLGFYDENGGFYSAGTKPFKDYDMSGAVLNDSSNKKYTFYKTIDLSKATKDIPLIVLNNASKDSQRVIPKVRIVDAHDQKNYIEIIGHWSGDHANMIYTVAAAAGQAMVGHLGGVNYYNGTVFGTETTFPTSYTVGKDWPATFYYDAKEKAVYADWYGNTNLVADFDADYQLRPWKGFTTGEVYVVVERQTDIDFICVENVAGQSLATIGRDTVAPALTVEKAGYDTLPYAVAGHTYPLFKASAVDMMDSVVPVNIHVYKGYDAIAGVEMNIQDGKFVPYGTGYYTIVYSASDRFNNIVTKKLNIYAIDKEKATPISAKITGLPQTAFVGDKIILPIPKNITGGSGHVRYQINLVSADGKRKPVTQKYIIIPEAGKNSIEYVFTDYLGMTQKLSFDINCTKSDNPILYDLEMPEMLLSGRTFTLPKAEYAEDPSVKVTVTATLDGKKIAVENNTITAVTNKAQSELQLSYNAKSNKGTASKTYSIQILNGDLSNRLTYFRTLNGSFEMEQTKKAIHLTTKKSDSSVRFINSVLADKLSLMLAVDPKKNDSDKITVTVSDALQPSISVRFDIVKKPGGDDKSKSNFYINGTQANDMVGNFYGGVASIGIIYKKSISAVVDTEGNVLGKISKTVSGDDFNGFPSGEVNIVLSVGKVGRNGFGFDVVQFNNQAFTDNSVFFDNFPEISIRGTLLLQEKLGAQIEVPAAVGYDVLSPNTTLYLTVRRDKEVIVDNQQIDKPYSLKLDKYGTYYVVYNYSDGKTKRSVSYPIQTIENNPPKVKIPRMSASAKLNEKFNVKLPDVSDDYTKNVQISVFVEEPNNNLTKLNKESMYFTPDKLGIYTIIYYVSDECNNYQVIRHKITVK